VEEKSGARRAPYSGTLEARPLAVLLAHASAQRLEAVLSLVFDDKRAEIVIDGGRIARVTSDEPAAHLGAIMYELGMIDAATRDRTLAIVASTRELHGQVLLREGAITQAQLDEALTDQTYRRLHALFAWPGRTTFILRDGIDDLGPPPRDASRPMIDAWRAIWRGVRAYPPIPYIARSLGRVDGEVQVTNLESALRLGLYDDERELLERISKAPVPLETLIATSALGETRTRALLWCVALGRALMATSTRGLGPLELGVAGIRNRARDIVQEDPWTALGVARGAPLEAARAAYFRLARIWHPDKLPPELAEAREAAHAVLASLCEAHRTITELSTASRRRDPSLLSSVRNVTRAEMDDALSRGDKKRALEIATVLARGGVDGPHARAVLAWCDAESGGDVERAIASLDRVIAGDPECVRALYYRSKLLGRSGKTNLAVKDLRRVVRLDPDHSDAHRDLRLLAGRTSATDQEAVSSKGSNLRRLFARAASRT
jgi:tetratricopeptide (TPR) repeat protein